MKITIIGAGVIGLTCALELANDGHTITVIADHGPGDTVSARAGALWFPYRVDSDNSEQLLERSLVRFVELAKQASAATNSDEAADLTDDIPPVEMRRGVVRERITPPDRSWVTPVVNVLGADAIRDVSGGVEVTLPMIMTPTYLAWLMDSCRIAGVSFQWKTVESLESLSTGINKGHLGDSSTDTPDAIVVATGLRGGELLGGDTEVTPIRGEIVVLANGTGEDGSPAPLTEWMTDEDNPAGMIYVFPRVDDIVVGGSAEAGSWDDSPNATVAEAIVNRARAAVPELAELPVLGHGAGLRPGRTSLRLGLVDSAVPQDIPVIAAYGHGGAGVTLSWGTAERVAEIIAVG